MNASAKIKNLFTAFKAIFNRLTAELQKRDMSDPFIQQLFKLEEIAREHIKVLLVLLDHFDLESNTNGSNGEKAEEIQNLLNNVLGVICTDSNMQGHEPGASYERRGPNGPMADKYTQTDIIHQIHCYDDLFNQEADSFNSDTYDQWQDVSLLRRKSEQNKEYRKANIEEAENNPPIKKLKIKNLGKKNPIVTVAEDTDDEDFDIKEEVDDDDYNDEDYHCNYKKGRAFTSKRKHKMQLRRRNTLEPIDYREASPEEPNKWEVVLPERKNGQDRKKKMSMLLQKKRGNRRHDDEEFESTGEELAQEDGGKKKKKKKKSKKKKSKRPRSRQEADDYSSSVDEDPRYSYHVAKRLKSY